MKDTIKKLTVSTMLLAFALTTPVTSSLAIAADVDLLAYSMDYVPGIRGTQATTVSLDSTNGITSKTLPISLSLRDSDVMQVLRMFADKAGLNIIFKGEVSGNVTMDLVNVPLNSAFNMVLTATDLSYSLVGNTLIITKGDDNSGIAKQEMAVIPVKYINAGEVANFLNSNIYGMNKPGVSNAKIASVNPSTNEVLIFGSDNDIAIAKKIISQFDKKPVVTSFKVNHSTPKQMASMICDMLLPSTGDRGGTTGGAAGIVTGFASDSSGGDTEEVALGEGVIACKAKAPSTSGESASLGLGGITVAYYTQLGTINLIGGSSQQIEMIKDFISENDKSQPQAYIEFSLIELNDDGARTFDNQWSFQSKHFNFNFNGTTGSTVDQFRVVGKGKNPDYFVANQSRTDSEFPYLGSNKASLLYTLNLLLKNEKARTISNPRLVVTNGKESVIDMSEDYVKSVTNQIITGTYTSNASVQRTYEIGDDLGIKIHVTPFISPDGYVYMNLKPEYTTISSYVRDPASNSIEATLLKRNNLDLKNVRVKDGDTLVIGGIITEHEDKTVSKIPFLGDIPGLGTFFRSTNSTTEKSELVILITPKIITDDENPASVTESTL